MRSMRLNAPDFGDHASVKDRTRKISPWRAALYRHTIGPYVIMLLILTFMAIISLWPSSNSMAQLIPTVSPVASPFSRVSASKDLNSVVLSTDLASLLLAIWGAGLSTWLAFRGWQRSRTRIGLDVDRNFRLGDDPQTWKWIALEVAIRNGSDRQVSIVEYGLTVAHPDGTFTTAHPIHHSELPNGDSVLEDPYTHERTAIRAHLDFLNTPVNLGPRASAAGWIAFSLSQPVPRAATDRHPMFVFLVDQERKMWQLPIPGLGESQPWEPRRVVLERDR